ncbi:MAG: hypothetical protein INR73_28165 [Williamsia sp.]|nr:hypothetical protein [Williamsia sp.]
MFYYYQLRNHHYKTEALPLLLCPLCLHAGSVSMSVMQKYYWLAGPLAPSSRYAIAWCEHCGNYIPKVKWSDEMDLFYNHLKKGTSTPPRLYLGLWVMPLLTAAFVGVLLLAINVSNSRSQSRAAAVTDAVMHPQPGTIFQVVTTTDSNTPLYTYFKVDHAAGDSLYLLPCNVQRTDAMDWDDVPTAAGSYIQPPFVVSLPDTAGGSSDMFTWGSQGHKYAIVEGVWTEGKLLKKY